MPVYNPSNLQGVTESGATTTVQSTFKDDTANQACLVTDVTDSSGFAQSLLCRLNGVDSLYYGTILGYNGFVNLNNNDFFFGNSNLFHFYLINNTLSQHTISVLANNYDFTTTALNLNGKNLLTTGTFSNGSTPIVSSHNHDGTGNNGAIIQHVTTQPTRALDTVYTNSDTKPKIIWGAIQFTIKAGGDTALVDLLTDANNPPTTILSSTGVDWRTSTIVADEQTYVHNFYMIVQPNHRYSINTNVAGAGTITLLYWDETPF